MFLQALARVLSSSDISQDVDVLQTYGRDWTRMHDPAPLAVCFPRSTQQVSDVLRLASAHGVAVVPSGGRTGLAAGAVAANGELVLSLEKMNHIGPVCAQSRTVHVQAGAITDAVQIACKPYALQWPVDFAASGSSHIGGNLASNAGGIRVIKYGMTRRWVIGLVAVLMDGTILAMDAALEKNNTGYNLVQLLIGSEGTLGIITEAVLKLAPLPKATQVALLSFQSFEHACDALAVIMHDAGDRLLACEVMRRDCLAVVEKHSTMPCPIQDNIPCVLLIEVEGRDDNDAESLLMQIAERLIEQNMILDAVVAQSEKDKKAFWHWREGIGEALAKEGVLHKNDVAVSVKDIPLFVEKLDALADAMNMMPYVFGHIGDGNLHVNLVKPESMSREEFSQRVKPWDVALFQILHELRGSISAEHGIGLLKKHALSYTRSDAECDVMARIKHAFDPQGLLNPGKVISRA